MLPLQPLFLRALAVWQAGRQLAVLFCALILAIALGEARAAVQIEGELQYEAPSGKTKLLVLISPFSVLLAKTSYEIRLTNHFADGHVDPVRFACDGQNFYHYAARTGSQEPGATIHDECELFPATGIPGHYLSDQILWLAFDGEKYLRDGQQLTGNLQFITYLNPGGPTNATVKKVAANQELQLLFKGYARDVYRVLRATNIQNRSIPLEAEWLTSLPPREKPGGEPAPPRITERYRLRVQALREVAEPESILPPLTRPVLVQDWRYRGGRQRITYLVTNHWEPWDGPRLRTMRANLVANGLLPPEDAPAKIPSTLAAAVLGGLAVLAALGVGLSRKFWRKPAT